MTAAGDSSHELVVPGSSVVVAVVVAAAVELDVPIGPAKAITPQARANVATVDAITRRRIVVTRRARAASRSRAAGGRGRAMRPGSGRTLSGPCTEPESFLRPAGGGRIRYAVMRIRRGLLLATLTFGLFVAAPATVGAKTVWLCKPGLASNPCTPGLDTARFSPDRAALGTDLVKRVRHPRIDCFYVYPTVSDQPTREATRRIDPELRSIALYQAAHYSRDCRVYAPVYRQVTLAGLQHLRRPCQRAGLPRRTRGMALLPERYNRGRGVVLIGHSQGTYALRRLIAEEIDRRPQVRRRLVSALLLGGNVLVRKGRDSGGDFAHVRACRSDRQVGCVVAFSTFNAPVPSDALFGRTTEPGLEVLCTNPAALGGGEGPVDAIFPSAPFAPGTSIAFAIEAIGFPWPDSAATWLSFPGGYSARCSPAGGADVLRIAPLAGALVLNPTPAATWGMHLVDGNIALGNLARLVRRQAAAYARARR